MVVGTSKRALVPSRAQSIGELAYGFVHKMVEDVAGKDAVPYFPYIALFCSSCCLTFGLVTDVLHNDISHRRNSGHGDGGFIGDNNRFRQEWHRIFISFGSRLPH